MIANAMKKRKLKKMRRIVVEFDGMRGTLKDFSILYLMPYSTIVSRYHKFENGKLALTDVFNWKKKRRSHKRKDMFSNLLF